MTEGSKANNDSPERRLLAMQIAVTGATGFIGRYIVANLTAAGHHCRCWYRPSSNREAMPVPQEAIDWVPGELTDHASFKPLVEGCDAVIHAALDRPGEGFRGSEGDLLPFVEANLLGSLRLIETARAANVPRFVFISTCAVHEVILDDRPLDEAHPLWATHHYGAMKAAVEKFVHSYGLGDGYDVCALRPTGVYGLANPAEDSKWYDLVQRVARGEDVEVRGGGKEVHAADVARAATLLLTAEGIAGQAYNCYDLYVSRHAVATIAKRLSGSHSKISGEPPSPKHQIVTDKIKALGMTFGGEELLERTIDDMLAAGEA